MIFTSYYRKLNWFTGVFHSGEWRERSILKQKHIEFIQISRSAPSGFSGRRCSLLFPTEELLHNYKKGIITVQEYVEQYRGQLEKLDVHRAYRALDGKILLCWEPSEEFCHRHIVSSWFRFHKYDCFELESILRDIQEYM